MRKFIYRLSLMSLVFSGAIEINGLAISSAFASNPGLSRFPDEMTQSIIPMETRIQGQVIFESRYTRVHDGFNIGGSTQPLKPQIYWTVVIVSENKRYLLKNKMNVGDTVPPEEIEIAGALLKPGTSVEVKGKSVLVNPNYFIFLDVDQITEL